MLTYHDIDERMEEWKKIHKKHLVDEIETGAMVCTCEATMAKLKIKRDELVNGS